MSRPRSREAKGSLRSQLFSIRHRLVDTEAQIVAEEAMGRLPSGLYRRLRLLQIEAGYLEHYLTQT